MKNKKLIILSTIVILVISFLVFDYYYFKPLPYTLGDVSAWEDTFPDVPAYNMALNSKNEPVFINPELALKKAKSDYSDAIKAVQKEYNLLPLTKYTYKSYGKYGWQINTDDTNISYQGAKLSQFFDIYENSFR